MDDRGLKAELERLVPEPQDVLGWDDVVRRAGRIRRRRQRRAALVAATALLLTLAAALGAAGQLSGLLSHTREPHLLVRGELVSADGARVGAIQIELSRAAIVLDGHTRLEPWGKRAGTSFQARWFLNRRSEPDGLEGALYLRRRSSRLLVLCSGCGSRESGRLDLSYGQASALVGDRLVFALSSGGTRLASARLLLDRAHLHLGLRCRQATPPRRCTRFYTGR